MRNLLIVISLFLINVVSAQKIDLSFRQFNMACFDKNFKSTFTLFNRTILNRTECNFKLSSTERKPVFCRMEDKLCSKFNIWLQLRAGSDLEYRKMAFPEQKTKPSKFID